MGGNFTYPNTLTNGETADADEVMENFNKIRDNFTPAGLDDASADNSAFQATADPFPGDAESLPTSTEGELQRIRYVLQQILNNSDDVAAGDWYKFPDLKNKTEAYVVQITDRILFGDATTGAFTFTLPTAVGLRDKVYFIRKADVTANVITITGDGSETINGLTSVTLDSQQSFTQIVSNGVNWKILGGDATIQKWKKGVDVASAGALTLGDDGNYFDITGTTAITSIVTKGIGTVVKLHFDAVLALTHDGADLILPGGVNITTAAGDEAEFVEYASGDWRCTSYTKASGNPIITDYGFVYGDGEDGAFSSGGSGNIDSGLYNNTTFIINTGHTMTVDGGSAILIFATKSITINGTLNADELGGGGSGSGGGGGGGQGADVGGSGGTSFYLYRGVAGGAGGAIGVDGGDGAAHPTLRTLKFTREIRGGGSGGAGGDGGGTGGAGGAGGGFILLSAPVIIIGVSGVLSANADNGGNGVATGGGGGGGGGGGVSIVSQDFINDGSITVTGGSGGALSGGSGAGGDGGAGLTEVTILPIT